MLWHKFTSFMVNEVRTGFFYFPSYVVDYVTYDGVVFPVQFFFDKPFFFFVQFYARICGTDRLR